MENIKQPNPENLSEPSSKPLKLNYKRTCLIAFAFFGILLCWGVYNSYCANFLTYSFAEAFYGLTSQELNAQAGTAEGQAKFLNVQYLVGIIMALDNLAALFLMPVFGNLSDKTKTPLGKRMPYIIVGTVVSAIALPFIPLCFHLGSLPGLIVTMVIVLIFMMMYRSPAVALMPDVTPKPLRGKANGIINIVGYVGGAIPLVLGMFLTFTGYINGGQANIWIIEVPFLVGSIVMLASLVVLLVFFKENKVVAEVADDMRRGDAMSETVDEVKDDGPLSKENKRNLLMILAAECLWFMSFNAIETYLGNYVMFYFNASSSNTSMVNIISGVASAIMFLFAGNIAGKIGKKWTIFIGLCVCAVGYLGFCFIPGASIDKEVGYTFDSSFPWIIYVIFVLVGLGSAMIHNNSFPLVVDFCNSGKIGKFTGYYYMASMLAQTLTPVIIGLIMKSTLQWKALPIYSACLMAAATLLFAFVKAPKGKGCESKKGLEALEAD